MCLIILGYHKAQQNFNTKIYTPKIFHMKFSQITAQPLHCLVKFASLASASRS